MVGPRLYAYARGVRSSRRLERMRRDDGAMRSLAGHVQPVHSTLANFRRRHLQGVGVLFTRTVPLAQRTALTKTGHRPSTAPRSRPTPAGTAS
jgi:hypothetical protein